MIHNDGTPLIMTRRVSVALIVCSMFVAAASLAKNGAFRETRHGDPQRGPRRNTAAPPGSCVQCHQTHHAKGQKPERALFGANDNELCLTCHQESGAERVWPGTIAWSQAGHATSPMVVRPRSTTNGRSPADTNKCVNCHDPHGVKDERGLISGMLAFRQEKLCQTCHDGAVAADVHSQFRKTYRHPIERAAIHTINEGGDPKAHGSFPDRRHSECSDCHNAHTAKADAVPPSAPAASNSISGVSRVQVVNGPAGRLPSFSWRPADDWSFANEYEICFKCHSSWTKQPVGQSDLALLTNPANASFHPIQATGKNRGIDPASFTRGWTAESLTYCSDCHASDDTTVRGPHGSSYRYILKKASTASAARRTMTPDELCFDCHQYDVYANPDSAPELQRASRFNAPAVAGHAYHVAIQRVPCFACHVTHGSVRNAALIATDRMPGIVSYLQTASGATCNTTCHLPRSYSVNYAR